MSDLGLKDSEVFPTSPSSVSDEDSSRVTYPEFNLRNGQIDAAGLGDCKPGDVYTATIKFKITAMSVRPDSNSKDISVLDLSDLAPVSADNDEGEDGEEEQTKETSAEKMLGYKPEKKSKPFPPVKNLRGF